MNDNNVVSILDTIKKELITKEAKTYVHIDSGKVGSNIWMICDSNILSSRLDEYFSYKEYTFSELFVTPINGKYFSIWETEKDVEFFKGNIYDI